MLIKLKVHPDSKKDFIVRKSPDAYEAWIRVPAERGLANGAALGLLAKALNCEPDRLRIIKGAKSPNKIIKVF
ncbi:MAG: DUF167 family protein [Elusimicrobiota bacterium]